MKINSYFHFHILHLEIKCGLIAYGACHDATMSQHKSLLTINDRIGIPQWRDDVIRSSPDCKKYPIIKSDILSE